MNIEDEIRRIVREEIEHAKHRVTQTVTHPPFDWPQVREKVVNDCPVCGLHSHVPCYHSHCPMRAPFVAYKANGTIGPAPAPYERPQPPSYLMGDDLNHRTGERAHHMAAWKDAMKKAYDGAAQQRMGCTCPPGSQTSCPDVTCPWKPR